MSPAVPEFLPGSVPLSILGAVWVWALALLLGAAVLRPQPEDDRGGRILAWLVFGVVIQSQVWLLMSWLELIRPGTVVGVAAALTLIAIVPGGRRVLGACSLRGRSYSADRGDSPLRGQPSQSPDRWLGRTSLLVLCAFFLVVARFAFWPTLRYDDLSYHLGLPRQALLTGSWPAMPGLHYSFMPAGWDSANLLPLALGGGSGPQLMNLIGLFFISWAVYRLARCGGSPSAAMAATAMLIVAPMLTSLGAFASNDLYVGLALCVAMERLLATAGRRPVFVGLMTGAAWAAKYTALPAAAGIGFAAALIRPGTWSKRITATVAIGVTTVTVALAWTLRSLILTGNPIYPSFYGLLGGNHWSPESAALVADLVSHGSLEQRGLSVFWMAGYDLLFRSRLLGLGGINSLFPILAVVGLLRFKKVSGARALILVAMLCYIGWCITSLNLRYALVMLAVLVPFAAATIQWSTDYLKRLGSVARPIVAALVVLAVVGPFVGAIENHVRFYGRQTAFLERADRGQMLVSRLHLAVAAEAMAADLPEDARVLLVTEGRLGLMPRPTLASSAYDTPDIVRFMEGAGSVDELNRRLDGFTHVVVNYREMERYLKKYKFREHFTPETWALFERWLAGGLEPVGRYGNVVVYRIPRPSSGRAAAADEPGTALQIRAAD